MKRLIFTFLFTLISTLAFADNGWYVTLHGYYYDYDYCIIYLWCPSNEYEHEKIDIYKNEQKLGSWKSKYEGQYVGNIGLKWPCTGQFEDWATYTLTVKSHIIQSDGTKKIVYYKCNFYGNWFYTDQDIQLIYEGSETENPTSIDNITNDNNTNNIYDLNGNKLSSLKKGLNIINGKKVFIR